MPEETLRQRNSARKGNCLMMPMLLLFLSLLAITVILSEGRPNMWRGDGERKQTEKGREKREPKQRDREEKQRDKEEKQRDKEEKQRDKEEREEKQRDKEEKQRDKEEKQRDREEREEKHRDKGEKQRDREEKLTERGEGRRRYRRQSLPTDNVLVFASNSNVSIADRVQVLSKESQIRILERNLNTTVWSNASLLQMSQNGEQISLSASQAIALVMKLGGGAQMEGTADTLQLNASSDGPSTLPSVDFVPSRRIEAQLTGQRVNVSLADLATRAIAFSASGARVAAVVATDWARQNAREEVRILSTSAGEGEQRELSVVANSPEYQVQIRLIGAESALLFRDSHLQIPADHRSLLLNALDWRVTVQSALSPFEFYATDSRLQLNCFEQSLSLVLLPDALQLHIGQLSSLAIVRSSVLPGKMRINGAIVNTSASNSLLITDRMEMISHELSLFLSRNGSADSDRRAKADDDDQSVLINAVNSHLRLFHSNHTMASLTAAKHFVEILGGRPLLQISAGNVSVEIELRKEMKPVAELNTDIVPKELMRTENVGDSFGSDPFAIRPNVTHPIVLNWTHSPPNPSRLGSSVSASSPLPSSVAPALNLSSISSASTPSRPFSPATPQMADPSELFTFRHSFPPPSVSPSSTEFESLVTLNESASAFPSPDSELFTFPPSLVPDADFLVGQFETVPSQRTTQSLFPLSATISALQFPEETADEHQQHIAEQFPGIRRENLLIWRPEENEGTQGKEGGEKLETYFVDEKEEEGEEGKRPRRTLNDDVNGRKTEERMPKAEMEVDIAVEGEEDVRAERLRRELGEGIERMLEECDERRTKTVERETDREETVRNETNREEKGKKIPREGTREETEEKQREERKRNETDREDETESDGASVMRVTEVKLKYLGRMDSNKKEVVRMHFTLEGEQKELEKGIRRIGQMDRETAEKTLKHQMLSMPRLTNASGVSSPSPCSPPSPSSAASSTLSAISAHSLPALFLGSLCLSAALLLMLIVLRPSARAFSRIKRWMKRKKGNEWKAKRIGGKMEDGRRESEGNGGGMSKANQ